MTPADEEQFEDAVHIFTVRANAKKYNIKKLVALHCPVARLPAKHNNAKAHSGTVDDAGGLESVIYLAKGARIVLKANLWVKVCAVRFYFTS